MLRTASRGPMMLGYGRCIHSGWRAPIWRERRARPRKRTASKAKGEFMNRRWIMPRMLLLLALTGCSRMTKSAESEGKLFVSGRIDGDTVDISSKRDGKIVEITVREGATVEAGQVVARILSPQDEAQVDAQKANVFENQRKLEEAQSAGPARVALAEANLAASQAELVRTKAQLQQAEVDAQRYPPLVEAGAAAEQTSLQQQTNLKVARASVDAGQK